MTVSAVIYSRNEADLLRVCLPAIAGFDEILLCDMQSSDDTVEVAETAGARIVAVPDARVIEEVRQLGLDHATGEWVLFVDADEILPPRFADRVREIVDAAAEDGTVAFRLRYTNVAFGRTLQHTLVGSAKYSLMRRDAARYPHPGRAHQPPLFDGPKRDAPSLVPPILHLNFRTVEQMTEKTMRYAETAAGEPDLLKPTGLLRALMRATVFSGSWRDGYAGVAVSTSAIVGRWYAALLALEREGELTGDLPPREQRYLRTLGHVQAWAVRWRRRLRRLVPRSRPQPPQSAGRPSA